MSTSRPRRGPGWSRQPPPLLHRLELERPVDGVAQGRQATCSRAVDGSSAESPAVGGHPLDPAAAGGDDEVEPDLERPDLERPPLPDLPFEEEQRGRKRQRGPLDADDPRSLPRQTHDVADPIATHDVAVQGAVSLRMERQKTGGRRQLHVREAAITIGLEQQRAADAAVVVDDGFAPATTAASVGDLPDRDRAVVASTSPRASAPATAVRHSTVRTRPAPRSAYR